MDVYTTIFFVAAMLLIPTLSVVALTLHDKLEAARADARREQSERAYWHSSAECLGRSVSWMLRHRAIPDVEPEAIEVLERLRAERINTARRRLAADP